MAELVAAIGTSHTPLLVTDVELWPMLAERDRTNPMLYDNEGASRSYDELAEAAGDRYCSAIAPDRLAQLHAACQSALDRLVATLDAAAPDVVIIVGDDQRELFDAGNQPAIAVGWGEQFSTGVSTAPPSPLADQIRAGYAMAEPTPFAGDLDAATALIAGLMRRGFDVASVAAGNAQQHHTSHGAHHGYGHAYGFVLQRLLGTLPVRVVPILLNTFYPPNQPSADRCHDLGRALGATIAELHSTSRVALVASGGLSHFVVDEDLDEVVVSSLRSGDHAALRALPARLLEAGSSEIRNWITVAGCFEGHPVDWLEYYPVRRSLAGTGVGCAFASWKPVH